MLCLLFDDDDDADDDDDDDDDDETISIRHTHTASVGVEGQISSKLSPVLAQGANLGRESNHTQRR